MKLFREAQMGLPPAEMVLVELLAAFRLKQRHLHADHDIPVEQRPDLRSALSNYRTRCDVCHNAKTAREDGGFGRERRVDVTDACKPAAAGGGAGRISGVRLP